MTKAVVAAAVLAVAVGTAGPASAAATDPVDAATTVAQLEAHGYRVVLGMFGDEPLTQCRVRSIRPERALTESAPAGRRRHGAVGRLSTAVYLDVDC